MTEKLVREIVNQHGKLSTATENLNMDDDLYNAGLTSLATVGLMLALEDEFDIEFPDSLLNRKTFSSIRSILEAVEDINP